VKAAPPSPTLTGSNTPSLFMGFPTDNNENASGGSQSGAARTADCDPPEAL
jgi:hypothetical protein